MQFYLIHLRNSITLLSTPYTTTMFFQVLAPEPCDYDRNILPIVV